MSVSFLDEDHFDPFPAAGRPRGAGVPGQSPLAPGPGHVRRILPSVDWHDLVLPAAPLARLHDLTLRARLGARGVLGLFAGGPGTGKTLSAEVIAADLGVELHVVRPQSRHTDLEGILAEAGRTDAVLLFHDVAFLPRLASFDGVALLSTPSRAALGDGAVRRIGQVIDFPFPEVEQRLALWRHGLAHVPHAEDLDVGLLAREFELAGGAIRRAVATAVYRAAGRNEPVGADDLLAGARREDDRAYDRTGRRPARRAVRR